MTEAQSQQLIELISELVAAQEQAAPSTVDSMTGYSLIDAVLLLAQEVSSLKEQIYLTGSKNTNPFI